MVNTFLKKNPFKPSTLGLTLRSAKLIGLHNVETSPHSQDAGSVSRKDLILFFGGDPNYQMTCREVGFASLSGGGGKFRITRFAKKRIHRSKPEETMENTTTLSTPDRFFYSTAFFSQESGGTNNACKD